jgi:hypothetical protein
MPDYSGMTPGLIATVKSAKLLKSLLVLLFALGLLACAPDTPETGVKRYWKAVAEGNADRILRTQVYYRPGMTSEYIWTIKDIEWLYLDSCSTVYSSPERAVVYYQVVFKKKESGKTTRYSTGTTAVLREGRWLVGAPVGRLRPPPAPPR